tara:strand:- start:3212 stop:3559 length:348 start_codon:yes stop_codon:yes gene_type:complete
MSKRYVKTAVITNSDKDYKKAFSNRYEKRETIQHLETTQLGYPEKSDFQNFTFGFHVWSQGDRLYKLANKYYGDPKYWWVIARFNKKPTEQHYKLGEVVSIPLSLEDALESMDIF